MRRIAFLVTVFCMSFLCGMQSFAQGGYVYTMAGGGSSMANGIPALSAKFSCTYGMTVDAAGNTYISDITGYVRKIVATTGLTYTVAGGGSSLAEWVPATTASINVGNGICLDAAGNLYIADGGNKKIRKIDVATGLIHTVVGGGASAAEGVPATTANIGNPTCVFVDHYGNIYTSDDLNRVRKVDIATGIITTIAGGGSVSTDGVPATTATVPKAKWIGMDSKDNIYLLTNIGNYVKRVDAASGLIYTVAGGGTSTADGVPSLSALLSANSCDIDQSDNVYIADAGKIRKVDVATCTIYTVAGGGTSTMEGAPALGASIATLTLKLDEAHGNIYFSTYGLTAKRVTYHFPTSGAGRKDSMKVAIEKLCGGPQFNVSTNNFPVAMTVKTWFGDLQTDISTIGATLCAHGGGSATINHIYQFPGTYTIKQVLYRGVVPVDSLVVSYTSAQCHTIPVKFYFDADGNCSKSNTEHYLVSPGRIEVDSNGVSIDTVSVTSGLYYNAYGKPGDVYDFKVLSPTPGIMFTCPSTGVFTDTIKTSGYNENDNLVGFVCSGGSAYDLQVLPFGLRAGTHPFRGSIMVGNTYCAPLPAALTMSMAKYSFISSNPAPSAISGNTVTWNFADLSAYSDATKIDVTFNRGTYVIGDTVTSSYSISPTSGDVDPANNIVIRVDTVKAGYDPNFIEAPGCIPAGSIAPVTYSVHFENTGNDTAFNIYVMDTVSDMLDMQSFRLVTASAVMNIVPIEKYGSYNIVKFDFPGINLLDSSHHNECDGLVAYTMTPKPGLAPGSVITNHAGIYFDYNGVVLTNNARTVVGCALGVPTLAGSHDAEIFPNPSSGDVTLKMDKNAFTSCTITNSIGQVLMQQQLVNTQTSLDVKTFLPGIYYVTLRGDGATRVVKFVKM